MTTKGNGYFSFFSHIWLLTLLLLLLLLFLLKLAFFLPVSAFKTFIFRVDFRVNFLCMSPINACHLICMLKQ